MENKITKYTVKLVQVGLLLRGIGDVVVTPYIYFTTDTSAFELRVNFTTGLICIGLGVIIRELTKKTQ